MHEVVDLFIGRDPEARVACETLVTTNRIVLAGEVRCRDDVTPTLQEIEAAARETVKRIGYEQHGFHWQYADFACHLHGQSADIAQGVDAAGNKDEGAGDQGIMFGYACRETPELMPAPIYYAHRILHGLAEARHSGKEAKLGPDSKSQITVHYANGQPVEVREIVISHQHVDASMTSDEVRAVVEPYARAALPADWITDATVWHVNPTGKFVIGGPMGDAGLTGRKIIVDTYGGYARHGGGAFSGKDPTKVDRSAAYAARYVAKNVVAAGLKETGATAWISTGNGATGCWETEAGEAALARHAGLILSPNGMGILDTIVAWPVDQDTLRIEVAFEAPPGSTSFDYVLEARIGGFPTFVATARSRELGPALTQVRDELIAAEGRKLTSFYAAPVCSPSRAALMTFTVPRSVAKSSLLR